MAKNAWANAYKIELKSIVIFCCFFMTSNPNALNHFLGRVECDKVSKDKRPLNVSIAETTCFASGILVGIFEELKWHMFLIYFSTSSIGISFWRSRWLQLLIYTYCYSKKITKQFTFGDILYLNIKPSWNRQMYRNDARKKLWNCPVKPQIAIV